MNCKQNTRSMVCAKGVHAVALPVCLMFLALSQAACSGPDQSWLLYRLPYANGTEVWVSNDHLTHSPSNRLDLAGVSGQPPYRVVAAHTGVIRIVVENNSTNCCMGTCANNYIWMEHQGGEWTKYSHLATNTVSNDAGLAVGDFVVAGTFLGYESDVGRACGVHLHFEVGVPTNPASPLKPGNVGEIAGINRIPRFCGPQGQILQQNDVVVARRCNNLLSCIRSVESPSTQGNCLEGLSGNVCVQEINNVAISSTYTRGVHFSSSSLKIDLDWCPNASCSENVATGRAIDVIVHRDIPNSNPLVFVANCQNRKVLETVHNVEEIVIQEAPNLSSENLACGGNTAPGAFARWEICEVPASLAS